MRKVNNSKNLIPAVCKAVKQLQETRGSSVRAITAFLQATTKPGAVAPTRGNVHAALRAAKATQKLLVKAGRYLLFNSLRCGKKKAPRKRCKSKSHKRRAHSRSHRKSRKHGHKRKRSLCKPRCQKKKKTGRKRRKCSRACTRMWKPRKGKHGKSGRKCKDNDEREKCEDNVEQPSIDPSQIKVENPQ